ncbi:radical SAM/SPASM domain-containing protein [Oceanotoga teriensis]|uniref:radical SAM/SPASM domain-containing protein n=1 Tax=Oceanotoga teriensis TaxID=515440 RepID=UPI002713FFA7|nr:radical SAM protein [Oceanotoga teriensis]MDO7976483.1 radical SAM protein [Oceanotoga teriensis]
MHEYKIFEIEGKNILFFPKSLNFYEINEYAKHKIFKEDFDEYLKDFFKKNDKYNSLLIQKSNFKNLPNKKTINHLTIDLIQDCNLQCKYCYGQEGTYGHKSRMDVNCINQIKKFFGKDNHERKILYFFGGEPLLNFKLIKKIVIELNKTYSNINYSLTTNGTIMDNEMASFIKKEKIYTMISLDGYEEEFQQLRLYKNNKNPYKDIINNIKILENNDVDFYVRSTLTKFNCNSNLYFIKNISSNIKKLHTNLVVGNKEIIPNKEMLEKYNSEIIKNYFSSDGILPSYFNYYISILNKKSFAGYYCGAGINTITLNPSGDLYVCHRLNEDKRYFLGNIERDSMENIKKRLALFKNEYYKMQNFYKYDDCKKCWARLMCFNSCIHLRDNLKKFDIKKYYCELIKINIKYSMFLSQQILERGKKQ